MNKINRKNQPERVGGFIAKSLPDLAVLHSWSGDTELIVYLSRDQCVKLADVLKSRLGNFVNSGSAVRKIVLNNRRNPTI